MKSLLNKFLAVGIIVLFIGVGIQPVFAVDNKKNCLYCELDYIDVIKIEKQIKKLQTYSKLLLVLSKENTEFRVLSNTISNHVSKLSELDLNNEEICAILFLFFAISMGIIYSLTEIISIFPDSNLWKALFLIPVYIVLGFILINNYLYEKYNCPEFP